MDSHGFNRMFDRWRNLIIGIIIAVAVVAFLVGLAI